MDEGGKVSEGRPVEPGWPPMSARRQPKPRERRSGGNGNGGDGRREWLQEQIAEAMRAVHRLPSDRPRGFKSCMPTPVRDAYEIFAMAVANGGQWEATVMVRLGATSEDIKMIDALLSWLAPLDLFTRRLVAGRGQRVPWKILASQDPWRRSVRQLRRLYDEALNNILRKIDT